eukprot:7153581-Pyramimonas_sp.AAC.1
MRGSESSQHRCHARDCISAVGNAGVGGRQDWELGGLRFAAKLLMPAGFSLTGFQSVLEGANNK